MQQVESRVLWEIEKQAKQLIYPLFEAAPQQPTPADFSVKEEQEKEEIPVFNLAKTGRENYRFFIMDRVSPQTREDYDALLEEIVHSYAPNISEEQARKIINIFTNYSDVCKHFYLDHYGEQTAERFHFGSLIYDAITIMARSMSSEELFARELGGIRMHLDDMNENGSAEERAAAVEMQQAGVKDRLCKFLAYRLVDIQMRTISGGLPRSAEANMRTLIQLNRLSKVLAEVLCLFTNDAD